MFRRNSCRNRQIEARRTPSGTAERFADALSCIDQCLIADDMLEQLPAASQAGKTTVGGIDLNKARMRAVAAAVIALSASHRLGCRRPRASSTAHPTVPATPPAISKSFAASTSFAGLATPDKIFVGLRLEAPKIRD